MPSTCNPEGTPDSIPDPGRRPRTGGTAAPQVYFPGETSTIKEAERHANEGGEVRIVQIKIEEKRREGGEDFFEGERGRNIQREREGVRAISVRSQQKPSPSSNLAVNAQEHASATEPEPQSGLQDALFTGTSRSLQVAHLGAPGKESQSGGGTWRRGGR